MRRFLVLAAVAALVACVSDSTSTIDPCVSYCDAVFKNCTDDLAAYSERPQCNEMCKFIPSGADDDEDTIECRNAHARKAAEPGADKARECKAASAYGGGVCGSNVVRVFCKRVESICIKEPVNGVQPPYASEADCEESASKITFDANGPEGPKQPFTGADTINCRMNHLILALDGRVPHCSHTALTSDVCK